MKKIVKLLIFTFILSFSLNFNVYAECTYEERTEISNDARNIEAFFEADLNNNKFIFYMYNLTDNLYVDISSNLTTTFKVYKYNYDGDFYSFSTSNINKVDTYLINIYSNKSGCYGTKITSKRITKGIINKYAKDSICNGIEEYYLCNSVLNTDINMTDIEVYEKINQYKKELEEKNNKEEEKFNIINFLKTYWYYFAGGLFIIIIILIIYFINKKRGELV